MNDTDLMKFHIAAVQMFLTLDEPNLPAEKVNRLKEISDELKLSWSNDLMKFFLQVTMRTCQIIKILSEERK